MEVVESSMLEVDREMDCGGSFRVKRAGVRYMDIYATPESFNKCAYVVIRKGRPSQTGSSGDHMVIRYPN